MSRRPRRAAPLAVVIASPITAGALEFTITALPAPAAIGMTPDGLTSANASLLFDV